MSTATVKVQTQADVTALLQMTRGVQDLTAALHQLNAVSESGGGGTASMGDGGSAASRASSGAPPPPPAPSSGGSRPSGGGPQTGAPPPTPLPPRNAAGQFTRGGGGGSGGRGAGGGFGGGGFGGGFARTTAATATGMALGSSISGFILGSGEKFMELDRVLTRLDRKFRSADESAAAFGGSLGFTIQQTAGLVDIMGRSTNVMDRGAFSRQAGFSRQFGLDPGATMSSVGQMERLLGRDRLVGEGGSVSFQQRRMSDRDLAQIAGQASRQGMDEGRMGEFISTTSDFMRDMFTRTGHASLQQALSLQQAGSFIFGQGDARGQGGSETAAVMGQMNSMLTSGGAMRSTLTRAMGFGQDPDLTYIELQKRLEGGIHDHRNVSDLFGYFQQRGLGSQGMFQALHPFAKQAGMSADTLEKVVNAFDTPEELANFKAMSVAERRRRMAAFEGDLSPEELAQFQGEGMSGLGRMSGRISRGEARSVELEGMQMAVGDAVSGAMVDLTASAGNLVGLLDQLVGQDLGTTLTSLTGAVRDVTEFLERLPNGEGLSGFMDGIRSGAGVGGMLPDPRAGERQELFARPAWAQAVEDYMSGGQGGD